MKKAETDQQNETTFLRENHVSGKWVYWLLALLFLVTVLIYFQSFSFDFLNSWDDNWYIINNNHVKDLSWSNTKSLFSNFYVGNYQPLSMLFYNIEYTLGGGDATIFHIVNIVFHLLNTCLVFLFIQRIYPSNILVAFITATFFAIHPMHVESVVWVSARKDLMYTFFFLLSLLSYLNYIASTKRKFLFYASALLLLSCLCKSAAVILPLIVLLLDYYYERKFSFQLLLEKIPLFIIALIFGIVAIYSQKNSIQDMAPSMSNIEHIAIVCYSFMSYIVKAFIPCNLSAVYTYPIQLGDILPLPYYVSIAGVVLLFCAVIYFFKKDKHFIFGFLFFLIPLLLVLQFVPVGFAIMADRYTYISYIGLFFIVGKLCTYLFYKKNSLHWRILSIALFITVASVFSFLSYARVKVWKNDDTLFSDVLAKYPNSYISYHDRGVYYVQSVTGEGYSGDAKYKLEFIQKGIADFNNALKYAITNDQKVSSFNNIGFAKYGIGDYHGAIQSFSMAIELDSTCKSAYINRAHAKSNIKNYKEALYDFDKAIALSPEDEVSIRNRAIIKKLTDSLEVITK